MSHNDDTCGTAIFSLVPDCSVPTLKCYKSWLPDQKWSLPGEPEVEFESFGVAFEPFQGENPEEDILNMLTCPAGPNSIRRSLLHGLQSRQRWGLNWYRREDGSLVRGTPYPCGNGQGETPCLAPLILILIRYGGNQLKSGRFKQPWI